MKPTACLNLILPRSLEDQVIDHLLKHPEWIGPFSAHPVDGHGAHGDVGSAEEQVRGRAARLKIEILIDARYGAELIAHLAEDLSGADVFWWLSPIDTSGSFQ